MKIWEAIIYAIVGGLTELLPISFSGHSILLQNTFHFSPLYSGDGPYVRAGISLGIILALYMVFNGEARESRRILQGMRGNHPHHRKARQEEQALNTRVFLLTIIGVIPMLFSFIFLGRAESITQLKYITVFFVINALLIFFCTRGPVGKRGPWDTYLHDTLLMGLFRMVSVFPGMSSVGTSLCVGRARGLSDELNIRFTYMMTLVFQVVSVLFYMIRGILFGSFYGRTLISMLVAAIVSAIVSFLALITFRNMVKKNKLRSFMYYCFDAAAIVFIIAIING